MFDLPASTFDLFLPCRTAAGPDPAVGHRLPAMASLPLEMITSCRGTGGHARLCTGSPTILSGGKFLIRRSAHGAVQVCLQALFGSKSGTPRQMHNPSTEQASLERGVSAALVQRSAGFWQRTCSPPAAATSHSQSASYQVRIVAQSPPALRAVRRAR